MNKQKTFGKFLLRGVFCVIGNIVNAAGIALFLRSGLGVDPVSVFEDGVARMLHIRFGTAAAAVMWCVLLWSLCFARKHLGVGTFFAVGFLGPFVTIWENIFDAVLGVRPAVLPQMILTMALGFVLLAFGTAFTLAVRLGPSVMEMIPFFIQGRFHVPYRGVKVACDVTYVVAGTLIGGTFGIGTILSAFCGGPVIAFFVRWSDKHILRPSGVSDSRNVDFR